MTINPSYPKTVKLEKPNGIFVIFNDYEFEDDFSSFLDFLSKKLKVTLTKPTQYPYSLAVEIAQPEGEMTAMFHDDTGCCVRIAPGEQALALADHIVHVCYGIG